MPEVLYNHIQEAVIIASFVSQLEAPVLLVRAPNWLPSRRVAHLVPGLARLRHGSKATLLVAQVCLFLRLTLLNHSREGVLRRSITNYY